MSTRSTAKLVAPCVCGRARVHEVHSMPPPLSWWRKLLGIAWPRWTWGVPEGHHHYQDSAEYGLTRGQLRRTRRALLRAARRAE